MDSMEVRLRAGSGESFAAYLSVPAATEAVPAIVVLQEIFGVNEFIRSVVDRFAALGYIAIAPDLFWRQSPGQSLDPVSNLDRDMALSLMKGMDQKGAIADALVAADYVRGLPACNGRVGAVGYCLGGKLAYLASTQPGIAAAVSYYGTGIQAVLGEVGNVKCGLLLHMGTDDQHFPLDARAAILEAMGAIGDRAAVMLYEGAGHAFARPGGTYHAPSAERAEKATVDFLEAQLGSPGRR